MSNYTNTSDNPTAPLFYVAIRNPFNDLGVTYRVSSNTDERHIVDAWRDQIAKMDSNIGRDVVVCSVCS